MAGKYGSPTYLPSFAHADCFFCSSRAACSSQFFSFHSHSRARGEANRRAEVFQRRSFASMRRRFSSASSSSSSSVPYGRQSRATSGDQRNRPRIAAAPYQPASAAVPRISTSMIHLRATSRLKVREPVDPFGGIFLAQVPNPFQQPVHLRQQFLHLRERLLHRRQVDVRLSVLVVLSEFPPVPSLFRLPAPSACPSPAADRTESQWAASAAAQRRCAARLVHPLQFLHRFPLLEEFSLDELCPYSEFMLHGLLAILFFV